MSQKKGSPRLLGFEKPQVEERFDYAELVRRQIERCLMTSVDELSFEGSVQALEALIPEDLQDELYQTELASSAVYSEKYEYEYAGPIRLGTPKKPLMAKMGYTKNRYPVPYVENEEGEKEIDWNNTNLISPKLVEVEEINWTRRFQAVFNQFYRLGLAVRRIPRG